MSKSRLDFRSEPVRASKNHGPTSSTQGLVDSLLRQFRDVPEHSPRLASLVGPDHSKIDASVAEFIQHGPVAITHPHGNGCQRKALNVKSPGYLDVAFVEKLLSSSCTVPFEQALHGLTAHLEHRREFVDR